MSKKILIFGATGMLGHKIAEVLLQETNYDLFLVYRDEAKAEILKSRLHYFKKKSDRPNEIYFEHASNYKESSLGGSHQEIRRFDYVINCIGLLKSDVGKKSDDDFFESNILIPIALSQACAKSGVKFIHFSTDCVFSGKSFEKHSEAHFPDPKNFDNIDIYSETKIKGERIGNGMILRTSIIGHELKQGGGGLMSWIFSESKKNNRMDGVKKDISGFINHFWSGVTTIQAGKAVKKIIAENLYENKLFHLHSETVSKYQLVDMIVNTYFFRLNVKPVFTEKINNRALSSIYDVDFGVLPLQKQINEMFLHETVLFKNFCTI